MRIIKKLIILLILSACPTLLKAQLIKWNAERPLVWGDFKGRPDYKIGSAAITLCWINYSYNYKIVDSTYVFTFSIQSGFDTKASWAKESGESDYLLGHEQLHFDINELYTRKLVAALNGSVYTSNYKAEIDAIYKKYLAECQTIQTKYDAETEHSNNKNMQYRWQLYIYEQLKALPRNYD